MCDEWRNDNRTFVKWALESGARRDLTIDRINVNGPYAPWNCRWVDQRTQANNRTNNRVITVDGVSMTIAQWAVSLCESEGRFYGHTDEELVGIIRAML